MKTTKIYVLRDPRTNEVRYVGKTVLSLGERLTIHLSAASKQQHRHSCYWVASLSALGLKPLIEQIEEAMENWAERERYWIAYYRNLNPGRLTNHTDGGEGMAGIKRSAAEVERLTRESKARWANPEYRETLLRKLRSPEVVAKRIASVRLAMEDPVAKERHRSATSAALSKPEVQARRRVALTEKMRDPEVKAKYLSSLERARTDPAIKAKHKEASKRAQSNPELRAHLSKTSAAAWTPERRARQAEIARRSNEKQRAAGHVANKASWTDERRAAAAERMRIRNDATRLRKLAPAIQGELFQRLTHEQQTGALGAADDKHAACHSSGEG